MLVICFASLLIGYISADCNYGYFQAQNETCMFNCEYSQWIPAENLTFIDIVYGCENIRTANLAYPDDCNSLDDIVWRNDTCDCPYCKCSTESDESFFDILSYNSGIFDGKGPEKECISCICSTLPPSYGINGYVYDCKSEMSVTNPFEWDDYQCPPTECKETTYYNYTYCRLVGYNWWDDVGDSETLCTEFCYCSGKDGKVCETGYENIMANDGLRYQFMSNCGSWYEEAAAVKYFL